eukprot:6185768-Pleurochrysis_carterae.AAC.7
MMLMTPEEIRGQRRGVLVRRRRRQACEKASARACSKAWGRKRTTRVKHCPTRPTAAAAPAPASAQIRSTSDFSGRSRWRERAGTIGSSEGAMCAASGQSAHQTPTSRAGAASPCVTRLRASPAPTHAHATRPASLRRRLPELLHPPSSPHSRALAPHPPCHLPAAAHAVAARVLHQPQSQASLAASPSSAGAVRVPRQPVLHQLLQRVERAQEVHVRPGEVVRGVDGVHVQLWRDARGEVPHGAEAVSKRHAIPKCGHRQNRVQALGEAHVLLGDEALCVEKGEVWPRSSSIAAACTRHLSLADRWRISHTYILRRRARHTGYTSAPRVRGGPALNVSHGIGKVVAAHGHQDA